MAIFCCIELFVLCQTIFYVVRIHNLDIFKRRCVQLAYSLSLTYHERTILNHITYCHPEPDCRLHQSHTVHIVAEHDYHILFFLEWLITNS
jgi:hypothetical protein